LSSAQVSSSDVNHAIMSTVNMNK